MKRYIFRSLLIISMMCSMAGLYAQWTVHPTVASVSRAVAIQKQIYLVAGNTLCVADSANLNNYTPLSRVDGLSGSQVFDIRYSTTTENLAIVYTDGNIDIMSVNGDFEQVMDIANTSVTPDHTPTAIAIRKDTLYLQTSLLTVALDLNKKTICYTTKQLLDLPSLEKDEHGYETALTTRINASLDTDKNMVNIPAQMFIYGDRLVMGQSSHLFYGVLGGLSHISILDLEEGSWSQLYRNDIEEAAKKYSSNRYNLNNLLTMGYNEAHPNYLYTACEGRGFMEFRDDTLYYQYLSSNTPEAVEDILSNYSRVSAIHGDADDNLWVVNSGINENQLRCRTQDGKWHTMPIKGFTNTPAGFIEMMFSQYSPYKFIWLSRNYRWDEFGGAVYYHAGTIGDTSDDQSIHFSSLIDQDGNKIDPQYLYATIEGHNGEVWILTSTGPFIVEDQLTFFNDAATSNVGKVYRVKVPRNDGTNLADYLLNNVACTCGVVDAANRKWIGTANNGLYHLSADGLTQLHHFTTDNSPIFDNAIQSLVYDGETGLLYIGTEGGICIYETDAINGSEDNQSIRCYPNPVRPEYTGVLTIDGLMDQSDIRITDTTGHVVYQTKSEGGMVTWDMCGNQGRRVRPGVYYIYSIDADGKDGGVCKVLIQ